jgi:predicted glutamine amidotransferase
MMAVASQHKMSKLWFDDFQKLARDGRVATGMTPHHDSGWGIAGYLGHWAVHFGRSEKSAITDIDNFNGASTKAVNAGSRILLSHVRKSTEGSISLTNTHPFIYKDWIFCHNGSIHNADRLVLPGFEYEGTTDSERFFKFLANRLERKPVMEYENIIRAVVAEVKDLCSYSSLTFLLANRGYLIAYRDFAEQEQYYTLFYAPVNSGGMIVCSEPLPGFEWNEISNGELLTVDWTAGSFLV